ncbi:MarR family transcriptional regulator [Streptomyces sp. 142MFCol3.1]|uniref:MarR family transcriptional regulator n=1 Tax=Streptomyces sp. 142MFCol3.1 TaxID=1172179 RepID=UPI0003F9BDA4|nr:MarR family transcriptional regulator [Streptomyces sp. 142MFCol3.1]
MSGRPGGAFHLRDGLVVAVESPGAPGPEARLLRTGRVSGEQWAELLRENEGTRWPQTGLIAHGHAGAAQLRVVCVMATQDAAFAVVAGRVDGCAPLDAAEPLAPVAMGEPPARLLQDATRKLAAVAALPCPVRPERERPVPTPAADGADARLPALQRELLAHADGRRTARDIAFATGLGVYTVTVAMARMLGDGLLELAADSGTVAPISIPVTGPIAARTPPAAGTPGHRPPPEETPGRAYAERTGSDEAAGAGGTRAEPSDVEPGGEESDGADPGDAGPLDGGPAEGGPTDAEPAGTERPEAGRCVEDPADAERPDTGSTGAGSVGAERSEAGSGGGEPVGAGRSREGGMLPGPVDAERFEAGGTLSEPVGTGRSAGGSTPAASAEPEQADTGSAEADPADAEWPYARWADAGWPEIRWPETGWPESEGTPAAQGTPAEQGGPEQAGTAAPGAEEPAASEPSAGAEHTAGEPGSPGGPPSPHASSLPRRKPGASGITETLAPETAGGSWKGFFRLRNRIWTPDSGT